MSGPEGKRERNRPPSFQRERKQEHRGQVAFSLLPSDREALERIADYYGTTMVGALRTMIRYFEVHLNLARPADSGTDQTQS